MEIKRVKKKLVVQEVMEQIKELIASKHFKPNEKIPNEDELAQLFGTGRTTIREAIKVFQHLGILDPQPRKGTYVCDGRNVSTEAFTWSILLGNHESFELIDFRYVIERRSLEILLQDGKIDKKKVEDTVKTLRNDIERMKAAKAISSMEELVEADYHFHGTIINSSGNNVYISIYHTLRSFMHEEIKKTSMDDIAISATIEEHQAILDAIDSGNDERIYAALTTHIKSIKEQLMSSLGMEQP